jgi:hypothetical protein
MPRPLASWGLCLVPVLFSVDRPYGPCPYCLRGLLGAGIGRVGPCGVRRVAQGARAELARHVAKGAEELPEPQGGEQQLMHKTFWRNVLFATTQKFVRCVEDAVS